MSSDKPKKNIVKICKRLHKFGFLAAADGNVSCRVDDQTILITPSGVSKSNLHEEELCELRLDGEVLRGKPSSETQMHLAVYNNCPKAMSVVHAHPKIAVAWTIARPELKELPSGALSELILAVGAVPIAPYARPGSTEMGEVLLPFVKEHRVLLLARHGALSWGENLQEAYMGIERLEHTAEVLKAAHDLGGITDLPDSEVEVLREMRKKMGPQTR